MNKLPRSKSEHHHLETTAIPSTMWGGVEKYVTDRVKKNREKEHVVTDIQISPCAGNLFLTIFGYDDCL